MLYNNNNGAYVHVDGEIVCVGWLLFENDCIVGASLIRINSNAISDKLDTYQTATKGDLFFAYLF